MISGFCSNHFHLNKTSLTSDLLIFIVIGTILDGKPIISLPPKSIELKKVDFSKEERDFYSTLESDSRAQFQVWFRNL